MFLSTALSIQGKWHLSGTDRAYKKFKDRSSTGCADSRIASTIYRYFTSYSRFRQAVEFFGSRAGKQDTECMVYAARAHLAMVGLAIDTTEDAIFVLKK